MNINSSDSNVFSPNKLISKFTQKCQMFYLGQQSDSQRFYRNLVTILEKEFNPLNTCIKDTLKGEFFNTMIYICSNTFCGIIQTNNAQQPFYDIFLSIPEKDSTINELIDLTYKAKIINSSKKCSQCGCNCVLIRSSQIKPNKYLSFNFQRGKLETRTLKNTYIKIDNLNLKWNVFYEPYAINFHTGTMDYGHYYR